MYVCWIHGIVGVAWSQQLSRLRDLMKMLTNRLKNTDISFYIKCFEMWQTVVTNWFHSHDLHDKGIFDGNILLWFSFRGLFAENWIFAISHVMDFFDRPFRSLEYKVIYFIAKLFFLPFPDDKRNEYKISTKELLRVWKFLTNFYEFLLLNRN